MENRTGEYALRPYVSLAGALALSIGTAIGWGAVVVTNSSYLLTAGPLGSVIGVVICALIMLIIAKNYSCLINVYPDSGGVYTYVKNIFGYDRAFLISWFVSLTYMSILWANATAVPLFARYFIGDLFRVGYLYTLFGYPVYIGEILLTLAVFVIVGQICVRNEKLSLDILIITVFLFTIGILICFAAALTGFRSTGGAFEPAFIPDADEFRQVMTIVFISPWAFIGFENISHLSEEFTFPRTRTHNILRASVLITTLLYAMILLMSVTAYPEQYGSWLDYIKDLDNLSGIEALPAFYVVHTYFGNTGLTIMVISLACLVISSLIGNITAVSRLFYKLSQDEIIPARFSETDGTGIPRRAVMFVILISLVIPLFGRAAIGWIVDVTTIGSVLLYGFISAAAAKHSRLHGLAATRVSGLAGLILMIIFGLYLVHESVTGTGVMSREGQLILIGWSFLGLLYFRSVMIRDHGKRFGKNLTVWMVLVTFIFILSMLWIYEVTISTQSDILVEIRNLYSGGADIESISQDQGIIPYYQNMNNVLVLSTSGIITVFIISIGTMLSNWNYVKRCENEANEELGKVKTIAYRDPLTGVKSKHAFMEREFEIQKQIDSREADDFAVLLCDVNGLKHVNDTLGHKAGDDYIKQAAAIICENFKHSPVFRTGGDEFVVLLNGQDYPDREDLVAGFNKVAEDNIKSGKVVISAGLADYDSEVDDTFHEVIEKADKLMYARKLELKGMGAITRE